MNQKRLILLFPLGMLAVLIGVLGWLTWREVKHERLNRQLIEAIKRQDTPTALSALAQGADANARDEQQTLPAWKVLWNRLRGKRPPASHAPTALILTLELKFSGEEVVFPRENVPLLTALLDHGAQVNVQDEDGVAALCHVLILGRNASARLLIQHGADVNKVDGIGIIPLAVAGLNPEIETSIVQMLLERGADPNYQCANDHSTPLSYAVEGGSPDKVRLLLHYHADPNVKVILGDGPQFVLWYAKAYPSNPKMHEIIQMLKDAGAKE